MTMSLSLDGKQICGATALGSHNVITWWSPCHSQAWQTPPALMQLLRQASYYYDVTLM